MSVRHLSHGGLPLLCAIKSLIFFQKFLNYDSRWGRCCWGLKIQFGALTSNVTCISLRYLVNPVRVIPLHVLRPGEPGPQAKLAGGRHGCGGWEWSGNNSR